MFLIMEFAMAPGYRRVLTTTKGQILLAINWEDVSSIGVVHIPILQGTLHRKLHKAKFFWSLILTKEFILYMSSFLWVNQSKNALITGNRGSLAFLEVEHTGDCQGLYKKMGGENLPPQERLENTQQKS